MPVDARLIARLRAEVLDAVLDDYVSIGLLQSFAEDLSGESTGGQVRLLVVEALATLVDHPDVKVVDASFQRTFSTPEELRAHVDSTWSQLDRSPVMGEVAWVVKRDFSYPPKSNWSEQTGWS